MVISKHAVVRNSHLRYRKSSEYKLFDEIFQVKKKNNSFKDVPIKLP
jgi:hypothetical protein